jgi:hypothetical protein
VVTSSAEVKAAAPEVRLAAERKRPHRQDKLKKPG